MMFLASRAMHGKQAHGAVRPLVDRSSGRISILPPFLPRHQP
jgi:hypothetical protein